MAEKWTDGAPAGKDERIVWEAKKRFRRCQEWEAVARSNGDDDERFANGDNINNYQWPANVLQQRQPPVGAQQPCLTINKARQHALQIINDARKNKSSPKVVPIGDGANVESAEVFMGAVRHIENISNATAAYDNATWGQVIRGIGYWRVLTDYANDGSFDQEIFIRRVPDPKTVYLDPDIQEADGSDARYGFVFVDIPRDQFELDYPDVDLGDSQNALDANDGWVTKDAIRIAEYYRRVEKKDKLVLVVNAATGETASGLKSQMGELPDGVTVQQEREVCQYSVEHYKIAGNKIIERADWPGKYVPLVRVVGEETVIDGVLDRKGHIRALRDPQRMYNYWSSAATEYVALQNKIPYLAPAQAIEGFETFWATSNTQNHAFLPFNHMDDAGNPIPVPTRQPPPVMPAAYLQGVQMTSQEMRDVSGQYQAEMGMPSNEKSGVAIERRQRQSDTATYHFVDRQAQAIRFTGKILIDLIPKIYDVKRMMRILQKDGTSDHVVLDPEAPQAHQQVQQDDDGSVLTIWNPNIGQYAVEASVGPSFETARQEAAQAFTAVLASNKELSPFIADLWMKNLDIPEADEAAKRLRAMIPPQALASEDPAIQRVMQEAQQKLQQAQQIIQNLVQEVAAAKLDKRVDDERVAIDAFRAETDRMKVVQPGATDDEARAQFMRFMQEMMQSAPLAQQQPQGIA